MFWSKNKKKSVYLCIPQFCYIKVGFKGVYIIRTYFPDGRSNTVVTNNIHHDYNYDFPSRTVVHAFDFFHETVSV